LFVTLKKKGELRGCIGHMIADEPLGKLVGTMALQAAFNDRRFPPLTADELQDIEIEISVLTPMKQVADASDILVGRDGVLLSKNGQSAVFLPQVATEQGWSREEMLKHLCQKAGLSADCWKQKAQFSTFQALVFSESEFK
jgi:AmmeMemoRadiSam system protein A